MWSNKFIWHSRQGDRQCEEKFARGIDMLPEARQIREEVFVREQGFKNEFDEIDKTAWHCVIFVEGRAAATGRLYSDKSRPFAASIGRVAVIESERGTGLGSLLMSGLEALARDKGYESISVSAQCRVKDFYRSRGYTEEGGEYLDEFCPHILMRKKL